MEDAALEAVSKYTEFNVLSLLTFSLSFFRKPIAKVGTVTLQGVLLLTCLFVVYETVRIRMRRLRSTRRPSTSLSKSVSVGHTLFNHERFALHSRIQNFKYLYHNVKIGTVARVMKEESADEDRHIPQKLFQFVLDPNKGADKYEHFLQTLLEYCKELFRLENKQQVLEQEARLRRLPVPQVLPSEKKKLNEKATKMANAYSWIIFLNASLSEHAFRTNKSFI